MNRTPPERRSQILQLLCEGMSIRAVTRITSASKNVVKAGAVMLRYAKDTPLSLAAAEHQSAAIYGFLQETGVDDGAELDPALCITLDCFTGIAHGGPSKAVSMFKNTQAACATIADAWPNTPAPKGAILK